jgi:hypothetical protein
MIAMNLAPVRLPGMDMPGMESGMKMPGSPRPHPKRRRNPSPKARNGWWRGWLRLGEQENCLNNHNADSCLLPIQGGGVHKQTRGSRNAIQVLQDLLDTQPSPYAAWLLNIAYMTLGEYPDQVPAQWRIPPEVFKSDYDLPRFPDVAGQLGLDTDDYAGGS